MRYVPILCLALLSYSHCNPNPPVPLADTADRLDTDAADDADDSDDVDAAIDGAAGDLAADKGFDSSDTKPDVDTADIETDTGPWINQGCGEPGVVPAHTRVLDVNVDLTDWAQGRYEVTQHVVVEPTVGGTAVTLFGTFLQLEWASVGVSYVDGARATFCTGSFSANDLVSLELRFIVDNEFQAFPAGSQAGLHAWGDAGADVVVGPLSSPYFANTWLFVPQSLPWVDPAHATNAVVDRVTLSVATPDSAWHVVGPGAPTVADDGVWSFDVNHRMPLYSLSFAASPSWVKLESTGVGSVPVAAAVMKFSETSATANLESAALALKWMEERFGAYAWGSVLGLAEIPGFTGGFEHVGGVWLGSSVIDGGIVGDYVVAHEVTHHWFGNDLTFANWNDVWLSEGFVEWLTVYNMLPEIASGPEATAWLEMYRVDAAALSYPALGSPQPGPLAMPADADVATQYSHNLRYFYAYGAAVLHMIGLRLGDSFGLDVMGLLQEWFQTHQQSSVTTSDFQQFLADATEDSAFWESFFGEWVYSAPCPTLTATAYADNAGSLTFDLLRSPGGGGQALPNLVVSAVGADGALVGTVMVDIPSEATQVSVTIPITGPPDRIVVDGEGWYVFRLLSGAGWSGPEVSFLP